MVNSNISTVDQESDFDVTMLAVFEDKNMTPREKRTEIIAIQRQLSQLRMKQLGQKTKRLRKELQRKRTNFGWMEVNNKIVNKWGKKMNV